jgi:hypothetical protein
MVHHLEMAGQKIKSPTCAGPTTYDQSVQHREAFFIGLVHSCSLLRVPQRFEYLGVSSSQSSSPHHYFSPLYCRVWTKTKTVYFLLLNRAS